MEASTIHHSLDLLVRLIDTTTGDTVDERNVRFWMNDRQVRPIPRGNGNYVFLNTGRRDGVLRIAVYGFEPCDLVIRYQELDLGMPVKEAFLIPSENAAGQPVITLSGNLPGLESIQAVSLGSADCCINGFDERKRTMKLFKTHRTGMDHRFYGLIHMNRQDYEPFEVVKELSENEVKISRPLAEPFSVNSPVARVVFGMADQQGNYVLRVRDDRTNLIYLIRYVVRGTAKFRTVDMRRTGEELQ